MRYPTVKQLRYFVALEESQHFGQAAETCHVSQSAFSNAIQELESLLEVQLVDRTNRQVTITAIGKEIAVHARLCLQDIEALVEVAGGQREPLTGDLNLGVIPTVAPFLLPTLLPKLRKAFPKLRLFLTEDKTPELHDQMMAGKLDVLLLALPYDLRGVENLPLFQDRFLLAYRDGTQRVDPSNHKLNREEMESVILMQDGHCLRDHAIDACNLRSGYRVSRYSATSLLTLVEMVDADLGITFLPSMAEKSNLLRNTRVKTLPMGAKSFRTIGIAWRKGSNRAEEFKLLGGFIKQNAGI
ncbi:MAG: hypothetical protein RLZZ385_500 [Pseudomonadota bacterium]|jgi:LysR family hydrogen peroxide-inducible transcriptional activator